MKPLSEKTVTEIVKENYKAAAVFKRHGISYCCGGNNSLETACRNASIEMEGLIEELKLATRTLTISNRIPFKEWKLSFLIDYIIHVHHGYLEITLPELEATILGFYDSHRKKFPFFKDILDSFRELFETIHQHNLQEEDIIFPYIKQIEAIHGNKEPYGQLFVRTLSKPLNKLESDNTLIENLLSELSVLTNNFRHPENACPKMQVIYKQLEELNNDLTNHKYLETKILLPKAAEIETDLLRN
jgi:regulator of cell morphogenesis and NO signaling